MPFRYRKSVKVGGVRLNINKKSVSVSAGPRGARTTISSTGRRTTTVGVPGTGMSYRATSSAQRSKRSSSNGRRPATSVAPAEMRSAPKPGWFAAKAEKQIYCATKQAAAHGAMPAVTELLDQAAADKRFTLAAQTLAGLLLADSDSAGALARLHAVWQSGRDPQHDHTIGKYAPRAGVPLQLPGGATLPLPISRQLVGHVLVQLHQDRGESDAALTVAQQLAPSPAAILTVAALAMATGRPQLAADVTAGAATANTDDIAAMTLAIRAAALRALGRADDAIAAAKEALRYPSRCAPARRLARLERGWIYLQTGLRARARADAEHVLADSPSDAEAQALLAAAAQPVPDRGRPQPTPPLWTPPASAT